MSTTNRATLAITIVAACIGDRLALNDLKVFAIDAIEAGQGVAPFDALIEDCRAQLAERFAHLVTSPAMGLASMQKARIPGASKLYSYTQAIRKLADKAAAGDAASMIKLAGLTTAQVAGTKPKESKPAGTKTPDAPKTVTLTVDDAIACIKAAAAAGALTEPQLAILRALAAPAPVKGMGNVVELQPLAIAG